MKKINKKKVTKEVIDIILFHLKVLKMTANEKNIKMASVMFIEGVKYIKDKDLEEQKKLLEGFSYRKTK